MAPRYEKPCATRKHGSPPWTWRGNYWELRDSNRSDCICAQYAVFKLLGVVPGSQEAKDVPEVDAGPANPSVITWLVKNGFTATAPVPCNQDAPDDCGCGEGQQSACAVVYQDQHGSMIHIAVFDPEFCDWGGKLSNHGPIVRFASPSDYCRSFGEDSTATDQMVFYCKEGNVPYVSDEAINEGLNRLIDGPILRPPPEEPVPDDFGLFPILRRLFGHWLGWLLLGLIGVIFVWLLLR
ncbi:MAG TPA: hypothetical protein VIK52_08770 [Opitutaceae bacterium]